MKLPQATTKDLFCAERCQGTKASLKIFCAPLKGVSTLLTRSIVLDYYEKNTIRFSVT